MTTVTPNDWHRTALGAQCCLMQGSMRSGTVSRRQMLPDAVQYALSHRQPEAGLEEVGLQNGDR